ncbi:MAG TPA: DUF2461 domain-containing protein, partial [Puia sp.]|nr:DUF2461 domain-containing protein [Puia sp.]
FSQLIQELINKQSKSDPTIASLKAKDCIFRINRDIRFSKDKTPYKTNMGASLNRGGKKSIFGGYYFHCEPGESFVGGGIWMPMPPELKKVRQEIDYCFDEFKKIIGSSKFKKIYGDLYTDENMTLVKIPQGFEKDSPAAEYIKMKSFIAMKPFNEKELLSKDLIKNAVEAFQALQPLLLFINRSLE